MASPRSPTKSKARQSNSSGLATKATYYAVLGLDRHATPDQIRDAYRLLAKRYHPDLNQDSGVAAQRTRALNEACETLRDPARRRAYDRELDRKSEAAAPGRGARIEHNITQEVRLRVEDFLGGTSLTVQVKDPAQHGAESYPVEIPAMTVPGARLRLPRHPPAQGYVLLSLKVLPGSRFKARGSDLRTDLRISAQRAAQGGTEMIARPAGGMQRLTIPKRVRRGELLRIPGEGLPKPRGGRGDLLVRVTYRPEVRVTKSR